MQQIIIENLAIKQRMHQLKIGNAAIETENVTIKRENEAINNRECSNK